MPRTAVLPLTLHAREDAIVCFRRSDTGDEVLPACSGIGRGSKAVAGERAKGLKLGGVLSIDIVVGDAA